MATYRPDEFVIVHIGATEHDTAHYRVFGSWRGGYLDGDSWRLNSGIVSYEERDEGYIKFIGGSGSVYHVRKTSEGIHSPYNNTALFNIIENASMDVMVVSYAEFKEKFDDKTA